MASVAVLTCRSNSFPFQERHITLSEAQKIGRSVARARPSPNNGIFDCKVLSRNHALLWHEDGKFYLQDTKSSNGTFVNNERLSKGSEESDPREIYSGDIIQFGVDVMENNRRGEKVTHACIIATATLYDSSGKEAKVENFSSSPVKANVKAADVYQLSQYLQEALHREKALETKFNSLVWLVKNTQEACENGWQALITEDKLLSRIDVLEGQLVNYSHAHTEDTLRGELTALQDEKYTYEMTAKVSLRRVIDEKLDAVKKCSDLEQTLNNAEADCAFVREENEQTQLELQTLAEKYDEQLNEFQMLQNQIQELKQKHREEEERIEAEKQQLHDKLNTVLSHETALSAKIESLQAENDFVDRQLSALKTKYLLREKDLDDNDLSQYSLNLTSDSINIDDIISIDLVKSEDPIIEEKLKEKEKEVRLCKEKLELYEEKAKEYREQVEQLRNELEMSELDSRQYIARIASLEAQVRESAKLCENHEVIPPNIKVKLEGRLSSPMEDVPIMEGSHVNGRVPLDKETLTPELSCVNNELQLCPHKLETERLKDEVENNELIVNKQSLEITNLESLLAAADELARDRADVITDLQEQIKNSTNSAKDMEQEIISLSEQLLNYKKEIQQRIEEEEALRGDMAVVREQCTLLTSQLETMESEMKMSRKENLQLSSEYNRLQESQRELEASNNDLMAQNETLSSSLSQAESSLLEMSLNKDNLSRVTDELSAAENDKMLLRAEVDDMRIKYKSVAEQSRMVSFLCTLPLLVLIFALFIAFYPFLESISATYA